MAVELYCKKKIPTEMVEWKGTNKEEIEEFCKDAFFKEDELWVHTIEGDHRAVKGCMIAKGVKGEFWPIAKDIFDLTYEKYTEDK
jgi:hypothetical protein